MATQLQRNETKILAELNAAQGKPVDVGGYYRPKPDLLAKEMTPQPYAQCYRGHNLLIIMSVTIAADRIKETLTRVGRAAAWP